MNPTNPQPAPQNSTPSDAPQPSAPPTPPAAASPVTPPSAPVAPMTPVVTPQQDESEVASTPDTPAVAPVSTAADQAPAAGAVVMGGDGNPQPPTPTVTGRKKRWTRKRLLLLVALPLVLALLVAGVVFGLYLPNTPNGVWSTGMDRTGTALDKLATTATEADQLEKLTASELTGKIDATWEDGKFSGDIKASFDEEDLDSGLQLAITDDTGAKQEMSAKLLTQLKGEAKYPDVYFQLSGFSALGLDAFVPGLAEYDGRWIVADSAYIESMVQSLGVKEEDTKQEDVTSADIHELTKVVTNVTNDYVFTTDAEKAVLVKKSFVGKEDLDGAQSYHYKANIDNDNAKAYCAALVRAVLDTKAAQKLSGADDKQIEEYKKEAVKDCDQDYAPKEDMDVWIGGKYRLVQKIRFNMEDSKDYVDIGQKYDNGDEITLYVTYAGDDKTTVTSSVKLNVKTYTTSFGVTAKGDNFDLTVNLDSKASAKDVKLTLPSDAIPLEQFLNSVQSPGIQTISEAETEPSSGILQ